MTENKATRYGFYIATALIVAVGMMVMWPLGQEIFAEDGTPAQDLRNEVKRTHNQAEDLDKNLARMIPAPPERRTQSAQDDQADADLPVSSQPSLNLPQSRNTRPRDHPDSPGGPEGPEGRETGQQPPVRGPPEGPPDGAPQAAVEVPEVTPTPNGEKYDQYANPTDRMTRETLAWMYEACIELECPVNDQYVLAVRQLHDEWDGRYQEAVFAHKRFAWRLSRAKVIGNQYFEKQRLLTESMPNRERRQYYRQRDQAEREVFRDWQIQADEILAQSNIIMDELRQMNIELSKQVLSAQFASIYRDFETVPIAITNLHHDLESFRIKSRELETRFGAVGGQ